MELLSPALDKSVSQNQRNEKMEKLARIELKISNGRQSDVGSLIGRVRFLQMHKCQMRSRRECKCKKNEGIGLAFHDLSMDREAIEALGLKGDACIESIN